MKKCLSCGHPPGKHRNLESSATGAVTHAAHHDSGSIFAEVSSVLLLRIFRTFVLSRFLPLVLCWPRVNVLPTSPAFTERAATSVAKMSG